MKEGTEVLACYYSVRLLLLLVVIRELWLWSVVLVAVCGSSIRILPFNYHDTKDYCLFPLAVYCFPVQPAHLLFSFRF